MAGLGKGALERDKTVVLLGQRQRSVQTLHAATQGATASVTEHAPDLIKTETELVIWLTVGGVAAGQAPVHVLGVRLNQVSQNAIARRLLAVQHLCRVQITAHPTPTRRNIQPHFKVIRRQTVQPGITASETDRPQSTQLIGDLLARRVRQIDSRLTGRNRLIDPGQLAMPKIHRRRCCAGDRQTSDKPSSRNRHCTTCPSLNAGVIQARTFAQR